MEQCPKGIKILPLLEVRKHPGACSFTFEQHCLTNATAEEPGDDETKLCCWIESSFCRSTSVRCHVMQTYSSHLNFSVLCCATPTSFSIFLGGIPFDKQAIMVKQWDDTNFFPLFSYKRLKNLVYLYSSPHELILCKITICCFSSCNLSGYVSTNLLHLQNEFFFSFCIAK